SRTRHETRSIPPDQTFRAITKGRVARDNRLSREMAANISREICYCGITHLRLLLPGEKDNGVEITAQQPCSLRIGSNRTGERRNLLSYHQSQFFARGTRGGKPVRFLVAQHFIEQCA